MSASNTTDKPGLPRRTFTTGIPRTWGLGLRDAGFRFEDPEPKPGPDPTKTAADYAALNTWLENETAGLRRNRDEFRGEKEALEAKVRDLSKQYEGLPEPDKLKIILQQLEENEDLQLIADGKHEEVVNRRVEAYQRDHEAKYSALETRNGDLETQLTAATSVIAGLKIDDSVRRVAELKATDGGAKIQLSAMPDVIARARGMFSVTDKHEVEARKDDAPVYGKDGKTSLTIDEWFDDLIEAAPHLFEGSSGGGANGSGDKARQKPGEPDLSKLSSRQMLVHGLSEAEA